jgi:hypothetical protein
MLKNKKLLLVLLLIAILGAGAGWYLQTKPAAKKSGSDMTVSENKDFLEIKEKGIKFKLTDPIKDAYYEASEAGTLNFGVHSLDTVPDLEACRPTKDIQKFNGITGLSFDSYSEQRIKNGARPDSSPLAKNPNAVRVGNSFYTIQRNPSCKSSDPSVQEKIQAAQDAFVEAGKTITKL